MQVATSVKDHLLGFRSIATARQGFTEVLCRANNKSSSFRLTILIYTGDMAFVNEQEHGILSGWNQLQHLMLRVQYSTTCNNSFARYAQCRVSITLGLG